MVAQDIMSPLLKVCFPNTTIREAAQLMEENDCGCLPVMKNYELSSDVVGIITDRDVVCRAIALGMDADDATVAEIMSAPVHAVGLNCPVADCARILGERGICRLAVLDESGTCCGILSQGDIARHATTAEVGALVKRVSS